MSESSISILSQRNFESTCIELRKAVEVAKWALLGSYDFGEILAGKGFPQSGRIKSFDICNARHANEMIGVSTQITACMPCRIAVYEDGSSTFLVSIRPSKIAQTLFGATFETKSELLNSIDQEVRAILESAAQS